MAIGARRLGSDVDCLAATGHDFFGELAEAAFLAAGLSPAFLHKMENTTTGAGIGFIAADAENCLAVYPGANCALSSVEVNLHIDAIAAAAFTIASFEIDDEPIAEAFAIARRAGRKTLLNAAPFRVISPQILASTSILVVNQHEGAALADACGLSIDAGDAAGIQKLAVLLNATGVEVLIVTLGAKGAVAVTSDWVLRQPAYSVEAIDTIGAGDAFVAGLATALAGGSTMTEALQLGAATGALTTTKAGTFGAFPARDQVRAFMEADDPFSKA